MLVYHWYCCRIRAGDIICSVNEEDFTNKTHSEAVNFLSALRGQICFDLKSSEDISDDDPSNLDYRFYKLFHPYIVTNAKGEGNVEIENLNSSSRHPGRAVSLETNQDNKQNLPYSEIPSVHSSPRK